MRSHIEGGLHFCSDVCVCVYLCTGLWCFTSSFLKKKENEYIPVSAPPSQIPLASPEKSTTALRGHQLVPLIGHFKALLRKGRSSARPCRGPIGKSEGRVFPSPHLGKTALPSFRGGLRLPVSAEIRLWFLHHRSQLWVSACPSHVLQAADCDKLALCSSLGSCDWLFRIQAREGNKDCYTVKSHSPPLSSFRSF